MRKRKDIKSYSNSYKARLVISLIAFTGFSMGAYYFNLLSAYLSLVANYPLQMILGTGVFIIATTTLILFGIYNRHIKWVKKRRVNILEKA